MSKKPLVTTALPDVQPAAAAMPAWWPNRLTRSQAAEALGVGTTSIRRREDDSLHPIKGGDGKWYFDPVEVAAAAREKPTKPRPTEKRSEGDLAAEAFRLFSDGVGFRDVVVRLRETPRVVRSFYLEWREDGDVWIPRKVVRDIRRVFAQRYPDLRPLRIRQSPDLVRLLEVVVAEIDRNRDDLAAFAEEVQELRAANAVLRAEIRRSDACRARRPPARAPHAARDRWADSAHPGPDPQENREARHDGSPASPAGGPQLVSSATRR